MSTLPYWTTSNQQRSAISNGVRYNFPSCSFVAGWQAAAAATAGLQIFLSPDPPAPPPDPPLPPRPLPPPPRPPHGPSPPRSPPAQSPSVPAAAATGPTFEFASPPPPPPSPTFMRQRRQLAAVDMKRAAAYARSTAKLRANMTVAQRLHEGDRVFGKVPTARELAARLGVSHLVKVRL